MKKTVPVTSIFSAMLQFLRNFWIKYSPAIFSGLSHFGKLTQNKWSQFWSWFFTRTMDVRIAIIVSLSLIIALLRGPHDIPTTSMMILAVIVIWGFVYHQYTWPVIRDSFTWIWKESLPIRRRFTVWACKVLFSSYGFPIAMISWGVVCFLGFGLTVYISKDLASMFGMAGFSGVIFGLFFYGIEKHNENCKIQAKETAARAEIAKHAPKQSTNTTATAP